MSRFHRTHRIIACSFVALGVIALEAQAPPTAPAAQAQAAMPRVSLTAGRSLVLTTQFDIIRVSVTNPAVADYTVVGPTEILIDGKAAGTTSLIMWGAAERMQYDVVVDRGVSDLQQQLQLIFPGEDLQASQTPESVILTGHASTNQVMLRAQEIAEAMSAKARVINMIQLPGGSESQQVMLQVRVAEINRRALQELGTSLFTGATGYKDVIARGTTQQFSAPDYEGLRRETVNGELTNASGEMTFSDFVNLFVFSNKYNVGTLIRALQSTGYFQSLAEPNLIAYNGKQATFLAGGELPIPVVQGQGGGVSVQYKEFGIRLSFVPIIAGDVIRLQVAPEVSSLDFPNGVTVNGFRIPAITTRRASTEVELRDGQSFAIAGLLNNTSQDTRQAVPGLSKLPIIGALFRSKAASQDRTEIMVLVTPRLVRALNPDEVPPLPTMDNRFLPAADSEPASGGAAPSGGPAGQ